MKKIMITCLTVLAMVCAVGFNTVKAEENSVIYYVKDNEFIIENIVELEDDSDVFYVIGELEETIYDYNEELEFANARYSISYNTDDETYTAVINLSYGNVTFTVACEFEDYFEDHTDLQCYINGYRCTEEVFSNMLDIMEYRYGL